MNLLHNLFCALNDPNVAMFNSRFVVSEPARSKQAVGIPSDCSLQFYVCKFIALPI